MSDSRRNFLKKSALFSLGTIAASAGANNKLDTLDQLASLGDNKKFYLPVLPYAYDALEPFIDKQTMIIHHSKHHQGYVDNLNKAIDSYEGKDLPADHTLENILKHADKLPVAFRNNAGGHYNHSLFWTLMKANPDGKSNLPDGKIADALKATFGSFETFQKQFNEAAAKRFGSGWAWLYEEDKKLKIGSTPNQDNPLTAGAEIKGKPILCLDVWEHAYYLKYQNKRGDYVGNWWNLVNWETVNSLL